MESIKAFYKTIYERQSGIISLMAITNPYDYSPLIDGMDLLLLVISEQADADRETEHVRMQGVHIQLRTIEPKRLERWLTGVENRSIIQWLMRGDILLDHGDYLAHIRQRLVEFPEALREQKRLVEFAAFLRTYLQAKQDLQDTNLLDAHSNILSALHHWAHIALIDEGIHPELTVWRQMRKYQPGIYKLYEELTVSPETLEQRVKLVLLACEFSVLSNMKSSCSLLMKVMHSRAEPWSIMELHRHPDLLVLHVDLSLVLQKLVKRGIIDEVAILTYQEEIEDLADYMELRYRPAQEA
ncbi:nucleotidyltransferase-like protein [Paenibacillus daejeonensis]|uniref:nucleotidyltransferase-like protein n=1 Tax=Paenibacillus daejeonensis TaxID=135193 RepID=UPI00036F0A54|nr:nucleotidyltransferase-like protein [Paenibacillus daejeonensis]